MEEDITHLQDLGVKLGEIVEEVNIALTELGEVKARVQILDARVKTLGNKKSLVEEEIKISKKMFDLGRNR